MPPRSSVRDKSKTRKLSTSSDSDSSSTVTVRYIKPSTKNKVNNPSSSPSSSPSSKAKTKKTPSSSFSENEMSIKTPSEQRKKSVGSSSNSEPSPRKNISPSSTKETQVKSPTEKKSSKKSKKQQVESYEESDIESQLDKLFPTDITGIISNMVSEFEGKINTFKNTVWTDNVLLNGNSIIYLRPRDIIAYNLNNNKTIFNVEHEYDIDNLVGFFNIRNNIVILQENKDGSLVVGLHKIKDGTKIRSKVIDLDNKINYLVETPLNIIIKIGKKLYIVDPLDNNNELTIMEKGDLILELSPDANPLEKWEKGFYVIKNNSIYIFDSFGLVNKITTDEKIIRVVTEGDVFYWVSSYGRDMYAGKYTLSLDERKDKFFKYNSSLKYKFKHGKIFLYGTYYEGMRDDSKSYVTKFNCVDLETGETEYIVLDRNDTFTDHIIFGDYINNKIVFYEENNGTTLIRIYDLKDKTRNSYIDSYRPLYLGTTSTNKVVYRDNKRLIVIS